MSPIASNFRSFLLRRKEPFQEIPLETLSLSGKDPVIVLTKEMIFEIFSRVNGGIANLCLVSKGWRNLTKEFWTLFKERTCFGKQQWEEYFGNIDKTLPFPIKFYRFLKEPSQYKLFFIPEKVNGKKLDSFEALNKLIVNPKKGFKIKFNGRNQILENFTKSYLTPRWMLVLKEIRPETVGANYTAQRYTLNKIQLKDQINFTEGNGFDLCLCIALEYVKSGRYLFTDNTLSLLGTIGPNWVKIGPIKEEGLLIDYLPHPCRGNENVGMAFLSYTAQNQ